MAPVVFVWPGIKPDMRLQVFDDVYHVHSIIMSLNCGFFRKFLNSPDKVLSTGSVEFKYEYRSKIDEFATKDSVSWFLVTGPEVGVMSL
jgi:hypothetical protein